MFRQAVFRQAIFRSVTICLTAMSASLILPRAAAASGPTTQSSPPPITRIQESPPVRGPELRLPGMPPIQLPPGAKVFGPNGERSAPGDTSPNSAPLPPARPRAGNEEDRTDPNSPAWRGNRAVNAKPKPAPKPAAKPVGREAILTDLFNRLGKAKSPAEARGIVGAIERAWLQSGSDTADLLMQRTLQAMKKKNYKLALQLLDKMVVIEPGWAEIWNQRATARYYEDNPDGAVADIAEALSREPRHFSALVGLGLILRRANQEQMALKVFRRAVQINPQLEDIKKTIEKLELSVEGQKI